MNGKKNQKLIKKDDKRAMIERVLRQLFEGFDFSDTHIVEEELAILEEKKKLTSKEKERRNELELEIGTIHGLRNGIWTGNLSHGKNFKLLTTMRSELVKEYDCKTSLELMIADRIVASYWRAMQCDRIFNRLVTKEDGGFSFDQLKINITKELNKSIELANRQLNTNIILLKEIKQPKLDIKVNTKNAFIGNQQQFNVDKQNENIEPK